MKRNSSLSTEVGKRKACSSCWKDGWKRNLNLGFKFPFVREDSNNVETKESRLNENERKIRQKLVGIGWAGDAGACQVQSLIDFDIDNLNILVKTD